jgi:hypothetical protein
MRALLLLVTLLIAPAAWPADQEATRPILPRRGMGKGIPKGARGPQMGPPLSNPGSPVARLFRATPEQRERALEKLPWRMQEQFRRQLERFDAMPRSQQQVLIRRAERFAALSPEQKTAFSDHMAALGQLSEERRREIGMAIRRLQPLSEEERARIVASDAFKNRFSPDEQKIVIGLSDVMNPPN